MIKNIICIEYSLKLIIMEKEFVPYELALKLKNIKFAENCFTFYSSSGKLITTFLDIKRGYLLEDLTNGILAPTFSQAINFLYICSNKQIDIELKASDTYEERLRKIDQGCENLWNLQNSESN